MHRDAILDEFSHQAEAFDRAPVMNAAQTVDELIAFAGVQGGRWLDVACGTGIVTRAMAVRADAVVGVDMTPAMLAIARRAAPEAAAFLEGDATALPLPDGDRDGAVTRFSLHHIPAPGRVVAEMARVVRPGGAVVVCDHVADEDGDAAAWHQEIERLRDPSHWACLTPARIAALGGAGLVLEDQRTVALDLDFEEWLQRGSGGAEAGALVRACLHARPGGAPSFRVEGGRLHLRLALTRWRRV